MCRMQAEYIKSDSLGTFPILASSYHNLQDVERLSVFSQYKRLTQKKVLVIAGISAAQGTVSKFGLQAGNPHHHTFLIYTDPWYTPHVSPPSFAHLQWFCSTFKWWKVKTCGYNFYAKLHFEGLLHFNFIAMRENEGTKSHSHSAAKKLGWKYLISVSSLPQLVVEILTFGLNAHSFLQMFSVKSTPVLGQRSFTLSSQFLL